MTAQEIFDKVATHLLTQGERSMGQQSPGYPRICAYRGDNGLKCAVGCLIPDDKYTSLMEGQGITEYVLNAVGVKWRDRALLADLQMLHDECGPGSWKEGLRNMARDYDLSSEVLNALP